MRDREGVERTVIREILMMFTGEEHIKVGKAVLLCKVASYSHYPISLPSLRDPGMGPTPERLCQLTPALMLTGKHAFSGSRCLQSGCRKERSA